MALAALQGLGAGSERAGWRQRWHIRMPATVAHPRCVLLRAGQRCDLGGIESDANSRPVCREWCADQGKAGCCMFSSTEKICSFVRSGSVSSSKPLAGLRRSRAHRASARPAPLSAVPLPRHTHTHGVGPPRAPLHAGTPR